MKNKFILFTTIFFLFASCKQINLLLKEDTVTNSNEKWFFTSKSNRYLKLIIQGDTTPVIFDTGGGDMITLYNPKFILDEKKVIQKEKKTGDALHIDKKQINYSANFVLSPIFSSKNMSVLVSFKKTEGIKCDSVTNNYGILGTNFYSYKKTLLINYENGYLQFLDNKKDYTGFYEADAKFNNWTGKIYLKLSINGTTDYFLFDTGNFTDLQIDSSFNAKANLINPTPIEAFTFGANSSYVETKQTIYPNRKVVLHKDDSMLNSSTTICYNNILNMNVLNLSFIQKYNWILDYVNKKVYYQPLPQKEKLNKNSIKNLKQKAELLNNKLVVSLVNKRQSTFILGKEIESIQGNRITLQNICDYKKLLNNSSNWDSLKVVIKN